MFFYSCGVLVMKKGPHFTGHKLCHRFYFIRCVSWFMFFIFFAGTCVLRSHAAVKSKTILVIT